VERVLGHEDSVDGKLATIAGRHERGEVLPGFAYRDESVFDLEVERLFQREWVSITCAQSVPEPGDVFPVMIAGQSLLVVCDKDGDVRVFYNLCRHRGAELVDKACKPRGDRLVCPYHAWSYDLKGEFLRAPYLYRNSPPPRPDSLLDRILFIRCGKFAASIAYPRDAIHRTPQSERNAFIARF